MLREVDLATGQCPADTGVQPVLKALQKLVPCLQIVIDGAKTYQIRRFMRTVRGREDHPAEAVTQDDNTANGG